MYSLHNCSSSIMRLSVSVLGWAELSYSALSLDINGSLPSVYLPTSINTQNAWTRPLALQYTHYLYCIYIPSIHYLHTIYTPSTLYLHKNCMNQIISNNMNTVFRSCTDRTEHHGHLNDRQIEKCWIRNDNSWSIQSGTLQNKNVWFLKMYENSLVVQSKIWWEIDSVKIWKLSFSGVGCML